MRWDVPDLTPAEQAQRARERMLRNNRDMLSGQGPFSERPTPARLQNPAAPAEDIWAGATKESFPVGWNFTQQVNEKGEALPRDQPFYKIFKGEVEFDLEVQDLCLSFASQAYDMAIWTNIKILHFERTKQMDDFYNFHNFLDRQQYYNGLMSNKEWNIFKAIKNKVVDFERSHEQGRFIGQKVLDSHGYPVDAFFQATYKSLSYTFAPPVEQSHTAIWSDYNKLREQGNQLTESKFRQQGGEKGVGRTEQSSISDTARSPAQYPYQRQFYGLGAATTSKNRGHWGSAPWQNGGELDYIFKILFPELRTYNEYNEEIFILPPMKDTDRMDCMDFMEFFLGLLANLAFATEKAEHPDARSYMNIFLFALPRLEESPHGSRRETPNLDEGDLYAPSRSGWLCWWLNCLESGFPEMRLHQFVPSISVEPFQYLWDSNLFRKENNVSHYFLQCTDHLLREFPVLKLAPAFRLANSAVRRAFDLFEHPEKFVVGHLFNKLHMLEPDLEPKDKSDRKAGFYILPVLEGQQTGDVFNAFLELRHGVAATGYRGKDGQYVSGFNSVVFDEVCENMSHALNAMFAQSFVGEIDSERKDKTDTRKMQNRRFHLKKFVTTRIENYRKEAQSALAAVLKQPTTMMAQSELEYFTHENLAQLPERMQRLCEEFVQMDPPVPHWQARHNVPSFSQIPGLGTTDHISVQTFEEDVRAYHMNNNTYKYDKAGAPIHAVQTEACRPYGPYQLTRRPVAGSRIFQVGDLMSARTHASLCRDAWTDEPLPDTDSNGNVRWGYFIPDESIMMVAWPNIRGKRDQLKKAYATVRSETQRHEDAGDSLVAIQAARFDKSTGALVQHVATPDTIKNAERHQQGIAVADSVRPIVNRNPTVPLSGTGAPESWERYDQGLWDQPGPGAIPQNLGEKGGYVAVSRVEWNFTNSFEGFRGNRTKRVDEDFDPSAPSRTDPTQYVGPTPAGESEDHRAPNPLVIGDRLGRFGPDPRDDRLPESIRGTFVETGLKGAASQYAQAGGAKGWSEIPNQQTDIRTAAARRAEPEGAAQVTMEAFSSTRWHPSHWEGDKGSGKQSAPHRDDDLSILQPAPVVQPAYRGKGPLPDNPFRSSVSKGAFKPSKAEVKGTGKGSVYGVGGKGKHDGQYGWHNVPPWTGAPQIGIPFRADQKGKPPDIPMDLTAQAHEYFQSPIVKDEKKGGKNKRQKTAEPYGRGPNSWHDRYGAMGWDRK